MELTAAQRDQACGTLLAPAAGVFRADHLRLALEAAVRGGGDTDTVAAIAGGLLGAVYGASAVPSQWRLMLNGWPGLRTRGLIQLADAIIDKGAPEEFDYTYRGYPEVRPLVVHPHDDKVWIGGFAGLSTLPADVDAVVSLCRVADVDLPGGVQHLDVRLVDAVGQNPNFGLRGARHCAGYRAAACRGTHGVPALRASRQPHTDHRRALRR